MKLFNLVNASTLKAPAGHYSHAVGVSSASETFYISGQLPVTAEGVRLVGEPFEKQVQQVFDNIDQVLLSCGCSRANLVQVRVYLCDVELWPCFNVLYAQWLQEHRPARCVVPVPGLHHGLDLEVEAVAVKP